MGRTKASALNQVKSLSAQGGFVDNLPAGAGLETGTVLSDDLHGGFSQINRALNGTPSNGEWTNDVPFARGIQRGVRQLGPDVAFVEVLSWDEIPTDDAVIIGSPVYTKAGSTLGLAQASGAARNVTGVALEDMAAGFGVKVAPAGIVTRSDWTALTGTALLTPGAPYFLSLATAGMMLTASPSTGYRVLLGYALTSTRFEFAPERPIKRA